MHNWMARRDKWKPSIPSWATTTESRGWQAAQGGTLTQNISSSCWAAAGQPLLKQYEAARKLPLSYPSGPLAAVILGTHPGTPKATLIQGGTDATSRLAP